jgi:hypothetical protein
MYRYKKRKVEKEAGKERVKREAKIKSLGYHDVYIYSVYYERREHEVRK